MLEARDIHFAYRQQAPVLSGVSLSLAPSQIIGLAGRSGGGKSTLGRIMGGYLQPGRGVVTIDGATTTSGRSSVQYLHQSSIFAVDPRWRIGPVPKAAAKPALWKPSTARCVKNAPYSCVSPALLAAH